MPKRVTCQVCGQHFQALPSHLRKHGMSTRDYRKQFPGAPVLCEALAQKHSRVGKRNFQDAGYRERIVGLLAEYKTTKKYKVRQSQASGDVLRRVNQDPAFRKRQSERKRRNWKDPKYRAAVLPNFEKCPHAASWTKPERKIRSILRQLGVYQKKEGIGFLPHRWLPTAGAGFHANGDFVDYRNKLVIHVDGIYWHGRAGALSRDGRLNQWCLNNGWRFLRLTDDTIERKPKLCRRVVHKFLTGKIVVLAF